jgi:hypothetical protein
LNTDLSVAPEIARLADPFVPVQHVTAMPRTDGRTAAALTELAATPQLWWDLVRFCADGPVRIEVPGALGAGPGGPAAWAGEPAVWLFVLPPGTAVDCDCRQATALAGEATEATGANEATEATGATEAPGQARSLRPGRVRVHGAGARHRLRAAGPGYSVTLHVGDAGYRSE